jgi:two-component system, OmpR family, response regulator PhoP
MRLLVIEDEQALRDQLCARLAQAGNVVEASGDGQEGLYLGLEYPFDVAVIDLGLPRLPGMEIIRRLRAAGKTFPILILTVQGRWQDKVEGLRAGADDYLVKPFHVEELIARLDALQRRAAGWAQSLLRCGPVSLDTASHQVHVDEHALDLTAFEYKVLEYLMLHAGRVVSKTELTEHLYEQDFDRDSNVIEVFIGRLRRKLDPDNQLNPIETLRGQGYRFTLPRADAVP